MSLRSIKFPQPNNEPEDADEYEDIFGSPSDDVWKIEQEDEQEDFATWNPADYYFQMEPNLNLEFTDHATLVTVTPKKLFDEYQELIAFNWLSTDEGGPLDLGSGFEEVEVGVFGFRGKMEDAKKLLCEKGMTLNINLLGDVEDEIEDEDYTTPW